MKKTFIEAYRQMRIARKRFNCAFATERNYDSFHGGKFSEKFPISHKALICLQSKESLNHLELVVYESRGFAGLWRLS